MFNNPFKENSFLSQYYQTLVRVFSPGETTDQVAEMSAKTAVTRPDFATYKVSELKAEAKARGYKGYTRLKKAELIDLLNQNQ